MDDVERYERPTTPRAPDTAAWSLAKRRKYLETLSKQLARNQSIENDDGRFLMDELDRATRHGRTNTIIASVAGTGVGVLIAGLAGWALTRSRVSDEASAGDGRVGAQTTRR